MRYILILIFTISALFGEAQSTNLGKEDCNIPPPKATDIKELCDCIAVKEKPVEKDKELFDFAFDKRLLNLAKADIEKDGYELIVKKLQCFWEKYKTLFRCRSTTFNVENGSLLKFAITESFMSFHESLVGTYGLDPLLAQE